MSTWHAFQQTIEKNYNDNDNNYPASDRHHCSFTQVADPELLAIDVMELDDHSRLTFTKRIKHVLSVGPGDIIAVYRHAQDSTEIIFMIQRQSSIVESWTIKRKFLV